jgi:hypothetical protein
MFKMRPILLSALLFHFLVVLGQDQDYHDGGQIQIYGKLLEPVANCALEIFEDSAHKNLYVFGGIDSTLNSSGIHNRCYKVDMIRNKVVRIPDLPDSLGKIALSATRIGNKIYVAGGYHVFANGSEKTSEWVHEFDPLGDRFTSKQIKIPVPVDDHLQFAYRDSLIYLIGGWSQNRNVDNVQIYDVKHDKWLVGTPLPGDEYKFFGASGAYISSRNEIVYMGGASDKGFFPIRNFVRTGKIDKSDPTKITWDIDTLPFQVGVYRSACILLSGGTEPLWIGGSDTSYNYNARAYSTGKSLKTTNRAVLWSARHDVFKKCELKHGLYLNPCTMDDYLDLYNSLPEIPMDIREVAYGKLKEWWQSADVYFAGGIMSDQRVSNKVFSISTSSIESIDEKPEGFEINVYPNPSLGEFRIQSSSEIEELIIYNSLGQVQFETINFNRLLTIDGAAWPRGIYYVVYSNEHAPIKIVKQ